MSGPSKLFATEHYPVLRKALDGGNVKQLHNHMQKVIGSDAIMTKLNTTHPGEQVVFGEQEVRPLYELTGLTEEAIRRTIKECPVIQGSWSIATKPYFWPTMLVLKYHEEKHSPEELRKMAVMFLVLLIYGGPGLQFKYFRRFYQPNAMAYAMNTLSDKFILKQEGTMFKTLLTVAWRSHLKYAPLLKAGDDASLLRYFANLWSRLNGMVKGLKNHYEQTKARGQYLNQSKDRHDDGELVERESDSGRVEDVTDKVTESFFGEPMPPRAVDLASQMADAPRQSVMLAVNEIRSGDGVPIREIVRLIAELYFEEENAGPQDLRTRGFLNFAHAVYTRSNTKDGRVERIKEILDKLLKDNSPQYTRTNREASKGAFRKALYLVVIILMQMKS